jgi:hypothetical protein
LTCCPLLLIREAAKRCPPLSSASNLQLNRPAATKSVPKPSFYRVDEVGTDTVVLPVNGTLLDDTLMTSVDGRCGRKWPDLWLTPTRVAPTGGIEVGRRTAPRTNGSMAASARDVPRPPMFFPYFCQQRIKVANYRVQDTNSVGGLRSVWPVESARFGCHHWS